MNGNTAYCHCTKVCPLSLFRGLHLLIWFGSKWQLLKFGPYRLDMKGSFRVLSHQKCFCYRTHLVWLVVLVLTLILVLKLCSHSPYIWAKNILVWVGFRSICAVCNCPWYPSKQDFSSSNHWPKIQSFYNTRLSRLSNDTVCISLV